MKTLETNEGAQRDFVNNPHRASAFIGGLGSGKTFAGLARGIKFSQQPMTPGTLWGPRGCVAAINYPVLQDVVMPQFLDMMDESGLWKTGKQEGSWEKSKKVARLIAGCACKDRYKCQHESHILFRSLDRPNWMRGLELSWFFIDEARHVTKESWKVLAGRLRQSGYEHAGWFCSTPNGYDWMWELIHPDSPNHLEDSVWYGAPTADNAAHLPDDYILSLFKEYEGMFLRQEVYGEFLGVTEGGVFYSFRPDRCIVELPYDPALPLHSMWDFGMGDLSVCIFGQIDWREKEIRNQKGELLSIEYVPLARLVGSMEAANRTSAAWAHEFNNYCLREFGGRKPDANYGDPAGRQRNQVTGTSVIDDLGQHGIYVVPATKKPLDYAVRILNNMMEADRVLIDRTKCARLAAALSSHHWKLDPAGNKTGPTPVHDWTSHYADAVRYWATMVFSVYPRRDKALPRTPPPVGTMGYVTNQLLNKDPSKWLGREGRTKEVVWHPGVIPMPDKVERENKAQTAWERKMEEFAK